MRSEIIRAVAEADLTFCFGCDEQIPDGEPCLSVTVEQVARTPALCFSHDNDFCLGVTMRRLLKRLGSIAPPKPVSF